MIHKRTHMIRNNSHYLHDLHDSYNSCIITDRWKEEILSFKMVPCLWKLRTEETRAILFYFCFCIWNSMEFSVSWSWRHFAKWRRRPQQHCLHPADSFNLRLILYSKIVLIILSRDNILYSWHEMRTQQKMAGQCHLSLAGPRGVQPTPLPCSKVPIL